MLKTVVVFHDIENPGIASHLELPFIVDVQVTLAVDMILCMASGCLLGTQLAGFLH